MNTWITDEIGLWEVLYLIALICKFLDKETMNEAN